MSADQSDEDEGDEKEWDDDEEDDDAEDEEEAGMALQVLESELLGVQIPLDVEQRRAAAKGSRAIDETSMRQFEKAEGQIEAFFDEVSILSKKKPDAPLNTFKIRVINHSLAAGNALLGKEYKPFDDFDLFDTEQLPTASDVVLMLSQYLRGFDKFRADHSYYSSGQCLWLVAGKRLPSRRPKAFDKRRGRARKSPALGGAGT